jgi:microcystin degradation protein MlrC
MTQRILLAAFIQETSSFNPVLTGLADFQVCTGADIRRVLGSTATEVGGALSVFDEAEVDTLPAMVAWSGSGGPVAEAELQELLNSFDDAIAQAVADGCDGVCLLLHGAMSGQQEMDPEGALLQRVRRHVGDDVPVVLSMDLHGILTDRMVSGSEAILPFHTYPHTDHRQTGQRAARVLLRLLGGAQARTVRIRLPMLVRGDELLTATGIFGEAIRRCQRFEDDPRGLAAGVLIGNPFTDVPDLRSNVVLTVDTSAGPDAEAWARSEALAIATFLWTRRSQLQAPLTSLTEAIRLARSTEGLCVFSDAADATSSGASGDSNHILRGLVEDAFPGRALITIVDAPAVAAAISAGVGTRTTVLLGGSLDPARHPPLQIQAYVQSIGDGEFTYEDGTLAHGGRAAVLVINGGPGVGGPGLHVLVTERHVHVMGRRLFLAHGLDPESFDLVSMKSPNGFRVHFESIAARIVPVDVPGSTSANLHSLPYQRCPRPIFPLDPENEVSAGLEFPIED